MRQQIWQTKSYLLGLLLFIYGMYGLIGLIVRHNLFYFANFALSYALSAFIRIPPPLGELPIILDVAVMVLLRNSWILAILYAALSIFTILRAHHRHHEDHSHPVATFILFTLTWIVLVMFIYSKNKLCNHLVGLLKNKITKRINPTIRSGVGSSEPLVDTSLPFLLHLHPMMFNLVSLPASIVNHTVINLPDQNISMDVWRLHDKFLSSLHSSTPITSMVAEDGSPLQPLMVVQEVYNNVDGKTVNIDNSNVSQKGSITPIMFFVHGGAWKGGGARLHTQTRFIYDLVKRGWMVICCSYRKDEWPNQLVDAMSCLRYVVANAKEWGSDRHHIHLWGASAGGHIVTQMLCELRKGLYNSDSDKGISKEEYFKPASAVLTYPVSDPFDWNHHGAVFPLSFPPLGMRSGQSLLAWFFEAIVLKFTYSKKVSELLKWTPLALVSDEVELLKSFRERVNSADSNGIDSSTVLEALPPKFYWPRTIIVHGELDSLVPVEQSELLYGKLQELRTLQAELYNETYADFGKESKKSIKSDDVVLDDYVADITTTTTTTTNTNNSLVGNENSSSIRICDELLLIPHAKHSYEVIDSAIVNAINSIVIDWIQH